MESVQKQTNCKKNVLCTNLKPVRADTKGVNYTSQECSMCRKDTPYIQHEQIKKKKFIKLTTQTCTFQKLVEPKESYSQKKVQKKEFVCVEMSASMICLKNNRVLNSLEKAHLFYLLNS